MHHKLKIIPIQIQIIGKLLSKSPQNDKLKYWVAIFINIEEQDNKRKDTNIQKCGFHDITCITKSSGLLVPCANTTVKTKH